MPLYPNGRAPKHALVDVRGCFSEPLMARKALWVKQEYDASHSDSITFNQIYRFIGNAADYAVGYQDWRSGDDRSGGLEFGASQYYVAGVDAAGGPSSAIIGQSNHGDWDYPAIDWACANVADRRALALQVGIVHNIRDESWHATALGSSQVPESDLPTLANFGMAAVAQDDGFDERDLADLLDELSDLRSIKLYALPGGWVWVGPGGRSWVVPGVEYAVLAAYLRVAPARPTPLSQAAFDFLTTQFLPTLSPEPANSALDRVLALSQTQVFQMIERMEV